HYAAELFLSGQDPYATFDLPQALARFGLDPELATHLLDGSVVRTFNYPALSFLIVAPFVWLGIGDIRWVYLGEVLIIAVLAIRQLRTAWRSMALATVVGNEIVTRQWILAGILPFIIGAPERAIGGILAPLLAPLVSDGVGLMRYGAAGFLPQLDRVVYTFLSLAALIGLLAFLWRRPDDLAGAPLVWPFLPLYLAW